MKYLLDTHAVFWTAIDSPKLGRRARKRLASAKQGSIFISDITLLELSILAKRGTIELEPTPSSFLKDLFSRLVVLPIDAEIAVDAAFLDLPHADPFDRVIVATARRHRLTLVTKDH